MPETCRVFLTKITFGKLVRLVGFIEKKFVTMHGHMNFKLCGYIPNKNLFPFKLFK